jgi:hypothetical protein
MRLLALAFIALLFPTIPMIPASPYQAEINGAVKYLVGHFNPKVGLIYESEDAGAAAKRRRYYVEYGAWGSCGFREH